MYLRPFRTRQDSRRNFIGREKQTSGSCEMSEDNMEEEYWQQYNVGAVPFNRDIPLTNHFKLSLRTKSLDRSRRGLKKSMATKVSNISHIIQRFTASCLLHPHHGGISTVHDDRYDYQSGEDEFSISNRWEKSLKNNEEEPPKIMEIQLLMGQVFSAVTAMKRAYVSLQEAHFSWDPERMRVADVAVVAEIQRLGLLRQRFMRSICGTDQTLREMVAPYEAAVEDLKREVKVKQEEVDALREKLKTTMFGISARPKGRSKRRVSCTSQVAVAPAPELFEATMSSVKEASKSFTSLLLSLMHSARWDISAVVRSIVAASSTKANTSILIDSAVGVNHSKYALESYVNKKIFQGFSHEDFYMDGTLSSMIHSDKSHQNCFAQYRDMKAMDPFELLNVLPTCSFGKFCIKKYLSIVHPKMEESLLGDLEQRRQLLNGHHPRSQFYVKFLELSKAVWLLHLLAFSLVPSPSHFEMSRWAEFHSEYMESVVRISGGGGDAKVGVSLVVGFQVSPGFKLGNGSIIKARVYLIPKNR